MSVPNKPTLGDFAVISYSTNLVTPAYSAFGTAKTFGMEPQVGMVETTVLSSIAKTFIPTIQDPGEATIGILYQSVDASIVELQSLINAPAIIALQLQLLDGTGPTTGSKVQFTGFLKSFPITGVEVEGLVESELKFQVTGPIVFVAAT